MTVKLSTGLRTALMDATSFEATFANAEIRIYGYTGAPITAPATADAAITGELLVTITEAADAPLTFAAAASGVLTKSANTWAGTVAANSTAVYWRLVDKTDDGDDLSTTDPRVQGTIGTAGADGNLSSVSLTAAASQTIDYFSVTIPAA